MKLFGPQCQLVVYAANKKYTVKDLHFDFDVNLFAGGDNGSKPNTAQISVYNLAETTRNLFTEEHQAVEFYAGYGENIGMIFAGQTTNVIHEKEPTGWRTDIYAGDGVKEFETRTYIKAYAAGTPITQILTDLCEASELPYTINADVASNVETLLYGESYAGRIAYCLDDLCKDRDWEWSVQHGVLEVTRKHRPLHPRTQAAAIPTPAVVLSADTGLVGSPVLMDRTDEEPPDDDEYEIRRFAVGMESLLNYEIRPKRVIELRAQRATSALGSLLTDKTDVPRLDISGLYLAKNVRHYGNNYGGEFRSGVEADLYD